jgi:hypothetical protein
MGELLHWSAGKLEWRFLKLPVRRWAIAPGLPTTRELACVIEKWKVLQVLLSAARRHQLLRAFRGFDHPGVAYRGYLPVGKEAAVRGWYWPLNLHSDRMMQQ